MKTKKLFFKFYFATIVVFSIAASLLLWSYITIDKKRMIETGKSFMQAKIYLIQKAILWKTNSDTFKQGFY